MTGFSAFGGDRGGVCTSAFGGDWSCVAAAPCHRLEQPEGQSGSGMSSVGGGSGGGGFSSDCSSGSGYAGPTSPSGPWRRRMPLEELPSNLLLPPAAMRVPPTVAVSLLVSGGGDASSEVRSPRAPAAARRACVHHALAAGARVRALARSGGTPGASHTHTRTHPRMPSPQDDDSTDTDYGVAPVPDCMDIDVAISAMQGLQTSDAPAAQPLPRAQPAHPGGARTWVRLSVQPL